jgi:group I intron endonuclease
MTCGIYFLRSPSGKMYIGSSVKAERRCVQHLSNLRNERHQSLRLTQAIKKYGVENFESGILEECLPEQLAEREQHWIELLKPRYNARLKPDTNAGLRMTEATRAVHSDVMKAHIADNPEFGEHLKEQNRRNWADPEKKVARIASLKAAWTVEKRLELSQRTKGIDKGDVARTVRWNKSGAGERMSEVANKIWDRRGRKNTPEAVHARASELGWVCVGIGPASKPGACDGRVEIYCPKHKHTGTPTVAKLMYRGQGCRYCGFERSSEKQIGRPKSSGVLIES